MLPSEAMAPFLPAVGTETAFPQDCQGRNKPAQSLPPLGFHPRVWGAVVRLKVSAPVLALFGGNMQNYEEEN